MINTVYSKETISDEIHTKWAGKTVHFAKETDSTNEWCKRMSKEGAEPGSCRIPVSRQGPPRTTLDSPGRKFCYDVYPSET